MNIRVETGGFVYRGGGVNNFHQNGNEFQNSYKRSSNPRLCKFRMRV